VIAPSTIGSARPSRRRSIARFNMCLSGSFVRG
jgi:hypothetical protein